ncbi:hypothetical protein K1719_033645 [Acacia pycnantha]|nr:hypothetical protein K1719_033645 [Acacia pycnantha]
MEEREQEREREMERSTGLSSILVKMNLVDVLKIEEPIRLKPWKLIRLRQPNLSPCRIEAFNSLFGQHMRANRLDLITISDIENVVNQWAESSYSREDISVLLEKLQDDNRVMIVDGVVHMIS